MTGRCPPSVRHQLRAEQPPVLHVACPHCKALEGQQCHGPSGRRLRQPHASRYDAAGLRTELDQQEDS